MQTFGSVRIVCQKRAAYVVVMGHRFGDECLSCHQATFTLGKMTSLSASSPFNKLTKVRLHQSQLTVLSVD